MIGRGIHALLVSVDDNILRRATDYLKGDDEISVSTISNLGDTVEFIESSQDQYDVLVVDRTQGEKRSDPLILKRINEQFPDTDIILIVSSTSSSVFETTRDSGFLTISENFGANELLFAVRLAGKQSENRAGNRKLTKLHELSLEIIRTKGLNEILTLTCKAAVEIFNVDHSGLVLFEKDLSKGKTIAEFPEQEKRSLGTVIQVKGIPAEENLVLRKEIINIFDLNPDKSLGKVRALLMDFGVRSILVVPVILSDNVIASFSLDMIRRNRQFFQDEIELCKHLGNHVAASIENARLIDELSVLNKIGQELSPTTTLTEDDILKMVYEQTSRLMDVTNFYVAFYYKDYDFVEFRFAIENEQRQKVEKVNLRIGEEEMVLLNILFETRDQFRFQRTFPNGLGIIELI